MQVLAWLTTHGTGAIVAWVVVCIVHYVCQAVVPIVHDILNYRVRCKEIELRLEQSDQVPVMRQSPQPVHARHRSWWRLVWRRLIRR